MKVLQNYTFGLWKIITTLVFLFLTNIAACQQPLFDSPDKKIISALNAYRDPLLKDTFLMKKFIEIADKFDTDDQHIGKFGVILGLATDQNYFMLGNDMFLNMLLKKRKPEYRDVDALKQDIDFVSKNAVPLYLIQNGIINDVYPFKLIVKSFLMEELLACNVEPIEYVAEIGAGDGFFSLLLKNIYQPTVLHLNELTPVYLEVIRNQYGKLPNNNLTNVDFIVGTKTATNLPDKYDKIIIRNTFHHFTEKEMMMKDIISKLKPEGKMIIIEVFKNQKKDGLYRGAGSHRCSFRVSEKSF